LEVKRAREKYPDRMPENVPRHLDRRDANIAFLDERLDEFEAVCGDPGEVAFVAAQRLLSRIEAGETTMNR
jgi:hypothetical protein